MAAVPDLRREVEIRLAVQPALRRQAEGEIHVGELGRQKQRRRKHVRNLRLGDVRRAILIQVVSGGRSLPGNLPVFTFSARW